MKTIQIFFVLLLFAFAGHAQNWKSIPLYDTTYFVVDCPVGTDSDMHGYLRCIWIDNIVAAGSDSIFDFNKAIVDSQLQTCANLNGHTFLGNKMVRNNLSGIETYYNLNQLPIEIRTYAHLNDTWSLMTDTSGIAYHGTVSNEYQLLIDGVTDSAKDISIQAYLNGVPVYSVFNNTKMTLSKEHGFYNTIHLNIFPACFNNISYVSGYLQPEIVSVHRRVERSLHTLNFAERDLFIEYKPGNEWITETAAGTGDYTFMTGNYLGDIYTDHDSIISINPINPNSLAYTFQRKRHHWHLLHYNNTDTNITYNTTATITDTVYYVNADVYLHTKRCSDIFDVTHDTAVSGANNSMRAVYYFLDSVCGNPRLRRFDYGPKFSDKNNADSCHKFTFSISGFTALDTCTIRHFDFKTGKSVSYNWMNALDDNRYYKLLYLKTDSCTYLNKINVFTLASRDIYDIGNDISVYPNPATDCIHITAGNEHLKIKNITLFDAMGIRVFETDNAQIIQTSRFASGIYTLSIHTGNGTFRKKLLIR